MRLSVDGPRHVYGIEGKGALEPGRDGDAVIVDPDVTDELPLEWLESRAGWSPYVGVELAGWPTTTVLRGEVVYRDGKLVGEPRGRQLRFA